MGIQKTLGGNKGQLIQQFLTETFIMVRLAIGVSFLLTEMSTTYFANYFPEGLEIVFFIFITYLKLLPNTDPLFFESKLNPFFERHGVVDLKPFWIRIFSAIMRRKNVVPSLGIFCVSRIGCADDCHGDREFPVDQNGTDESCG
ncbi:MAG: hypothetical protein WD431_04020 [Cyclobacteriaceae bacterium]